MFDPSLSWPQFYTLFAVGSFWFWVLLLGANLLLLFATETKRGWLATSSVVAFLAALQFCGGVDVIGYLVEHPLAVFTVAGVYLGAGVVWATVKWWWFVNLQKGRYDELKADFLEGKGVLPESGKSLWESPIPEELKVEWSELVHDQSTATNHDALTPHPQVTKHKTDITRWMSYWPWSLLYTLCNDAIRHACEQILHHMRSYLQGMSDRAWSSARDDFYSPEILDQKKGSKMVGS
jgi:hypothetical protein